VGDHDEHGDGGRVVDVSDRITNEDLRWLRQERMYWTPERKALVEALEKTVTIERLPAIKRLVDASTVLQYLWAFALATLTILGLPMVGKALGWILSRIGEMK
jgi:hypothetical protein